MEKKLKERERLKDLDVPRERTTRGMERFNGKGWGMFCFGVSVSNELYEGALEHFPSMSLSPPARVVSYTCKVFG